MNQRVFYAAGTSPALTVAARELEKRGANVVSEPAKNVTHLLLPVPCRMDDVELGIILGQLPERITVLGGFLSSSELSGYRCFDLLKDEIYLAKNAQITADCALKVAAEKLPVVWQDCPVLIVGWGRIGKCLGRLLKSMGADVSVSARKESDRAMISALGYEAEDTGKLDYILKRYRVVFNTVPCPVLSEEQLAYCRPDCLKIELASKPGIAGDDVIEAKGLPGKLAPESSGKLIARTVLRLCARKEEQL